MTDLPPHIRELMEQEIRNHPSRVVRIVDYLVVSADDFTGPTPAGHGGVLELGRGVRLERIDHGLAERIFDATTLRGEDWSPRRQFSAIHAYVRDAWSEDDGEPLDDLSGWDSDPRIWPAVQLSRLIRDNNASTEFAARRVIRADGGEKLIPFAGYESHVVYRLYPGERGWLDTDEALELRTLLEAFSEGPQLPERVRRALRRADVITRERYLEDATPQVVTAFESLVKIGRGHLTAQFAQRVPALAAEVEIELTEADCEDVYDSRSALVHGGDVDLSQPHELDEFGRRFNALQEALRRVVRRAIEDREFADLFAADARITERWPTTVRVRVEVDRII